MAVRVFESSLGGTGIERAVVRPVVLFDEPLTVVKDYVYVDYDQILYLTASA